MNKTTLYATLFALFMFGLSFASAPLYDMFCRTTGFAGATIEAKERPNRISNREFLITFDSTLAPGLIWSFTAEKRDVKIKAGEVITINYEAHNKGKEAITGVASYNVTPPQVGRYFNKLQCFCYTDQTIEPGERKEMPVVFFIDPEIEKDPEFRKLGEISLHYTFFPSKKFPKTISQLDEAKKIQ